MLYLNAKYCLLLLVIFTFHLSYILTYNCVSIFTIFLSLFIFIFFFKVIEVQTRCHAPSKMFDSVNWKFKYRLTIRIRSFVHLFLSIPIWILKIFWIFKCELLNKMFENFDEWGTKRSWGFALRISLWLRTSSDWKSKSEVIFHQQVPSDKFFPFRGTLHFPVFLLLF